MKKPPQCPHCQVQLEQAKLSDSHQKIWLCPQGQGLALPLESSKSLTSSSFVSRLWTRWLLRREPRILPCPFCSDRLMRITALEQNSLELDVCLGCFGIWLDPHEDQKLKKLFLNLQNQTDSLSDVDHELWQAYGKSLLEHMARIDRSKSLQELGLSLNRRVRFWERLRFF